MRVLFTTFAGTGHLHPLVPLAHALTAEGIDLQVHPATRRPDGGDHSRERLCASVEQRKSALLSFTAPRRVTRR